MKKSKSDKELLNRINAVRGRERDTLSRPRSTVFKDKTKYSRPQEKQKTDYNDYEPDF